MNTTRFTLLPLTLLLLQACGGDAPTAPSTGSSAPAASGSRSEPISCAEYLPEVRAAILGTLRGTERNGLITLVSSVSEFTDGSASDQSSVQIPESVCSAFGKKLRKARRPDSDAPFTLAPACAARIEGIDADCLKPLAERGVALNSACNRALLSMSSGRDDLAQIMANGEYCAATQ